ncbi:hypothetical protein HPB47_002148 [Ixodes persulcatus]|uniref:Uncharacterized protein n=1 Tax=Ixodes persulcatus TaxID=34615 RepID=A0AC60PMZ7_IXOPE|nr:hypothetical protein HPB47_002148 [Ixodes persulcatus]
MDGGASASPLASQPASCRRFAITDDIVLLHEVVALNPLRNATQWTAVTDNLNAATGRSFTVRSVRERCDLLLGHLRREDRSNLRKSGTEEQYTVKEQLLQEISDLACEFGYLPKVLPRSSSGVASSTAGTAAGQVSIQREWIPKLSTVCIDMSQRIGLLAFYKEVMKIPRSVTPTTKLEDDSEDGLDVSSEEEWEGPEDAGEAGEPGDALGSSDSDSSQHDSENPLPTTSKVTAKKKTTVWLLEKDNAHAEDKVQKHWRYLWDKLVCLLRDMQKTKTSSACADDVEDPMAWAHFKKMCFVRDSLKQRR